MNLQITSYINYSKYIDELIGTNLRKERQMKITKKDLKKIISQKNRKLIKEFVFILNNQDTKTI